MIINVDTGKLDKECELNRCYACSGCVNYYDESDTACKCGCIHYFNKFMKQEDKELLLSLLKKADENVHS